MPEPLAQPPLSRSCWRGPIAAVVVAAAALLAACGGDEFQYIANRDANVFLRLPDGWQVFGQDEILEAQQAAGVSADRVQPTQDRIWMRGFDASPGAKVEDVLQLGGDQLRGFAEVRPLAPAERDAVSLASLRGIGFGVDPVAAAQDPESGVEIRQLEEISDDHVRGVHIVASITSDSGTIVVAQTALVDTDTTTLYRLSLSCSVRCYDDNVDVIDQVTASWRVVEV